MFRRRLCYLLISYLFCQVDCEPTGATEESCGDIFPMHYSDNNKTMFQDNFACNSTNLASFGFTKCFELIVEGFDNMSNFTYNCGQSYNVTLTGDTGTLRGYMIVARNKSEEYIVDSALVGNWSVPAELQEDAHTLCGGQAISQSRVNTILNSVTFTWTAPDYNNALELKFWYTVVSAPTAFFAQIEGQSGVPNEATCGCRLNRYYTSSTVCLDCPANSVSPGGFASSCTCEEDYGRQTSNLKADCEACPKVDKINVRLDGTSVIAMWNVAIADGWTPMYRVTVTGDNGDVVFNQDVGGSPSETLTNLTENIQYNVTVYVRVTEDVSCLSSESVIVTRCLENQFHIALNSLTSSESCQNCPANSISPGGFASYCTCVEGYGRKMSMSLSSDCEANPTPTPPPTPTPTPNALMTGQIAGIAVGAILAVIVALGLIIVIVFIVVRFYPCLNKQQTTKTAKDNEYEVASSNNKCEEIDIKSNPAYQSTDPPNEEKDL